MKDIINFNDAKTDIEIAPYLNLYKVARLVEVVDIRDTDVDIKDYATQCTGFVFGLDFVTFEKNPKVFPINLSLNNLDGCYVDEKGIYVSELRDVKKNEVFFYDTLVADLDLAKKIEKWYFEKYLPNNGEYYNNSTYLMNNDAVFFGSTNLNEAPIYKLSDYSNKKK